MDPVAQIDFKIAILNGHSRTEHWVQLPADSQGTDLKSSVTELVSNLLIEKPILRIIHAGYEIMNDYNLEEITPNSPILVLMSHFFQ